MSPIEAIPCATDVLALKRRKVQLVKAKLLKTDRNLYWARYHHLNKRNEHLKFYDDREFLVDIYKSAHTKQRMCIKKSVQCGVTECFVVSHLEQAERGLSVLYVLPKTDIRNRFVNNRINRTIAKVPEYRKILASSPNKTDSASFKLFGNGAINYVSSNSEANFTEYPADAVYYDEKDRMDQNVILLAKDRLSDSDYKFERIVGNPTIAEFGISADYDDSTQGVRMFKCPHCGKWQPYDFFENIVKTVGKRQYEVLDTKWLDEPNRDVKMYCSNNSCMKEVPRFGLQSQWVHAFPNSDTEGFQINKIFSPQGTIRDLVKTMVKAKTSEYKFQVFLNSDLGLEMRGGGTQITREAVIATKQDYVCGGHLVKEGTRYAGCDVGGDLHFIVREKVDGRKKLIFKGKLKTEHDVVRYMQMYNVKTLVIDAMPEERMIERLKKVNARIWSCYFPRTKETRFNRNDRIINVRRTVCIDRVKENYDNTMYVNPRDILQDEEYMKHMESNVRIADLESGEFIWQQKASRPDHYLLTEGYCDLAGEIAIGTDLFAYYEQVGKQNDAEVAVMRAQVHDEMDDLPKEEKERLQGISGMGVSAFFQQVQEESIKQDFEDQLYGEEIY